MRSFTWGLVAAIAVIVMSFLAATWYLRGAQVPIRAAARNVLDDAAPSIERLSAARTVLREIDRRIDLAVARVEDRRVADRTQLDRLRRQLDHELTQYLALPALFEQLEHYQRTVGIRLRRLDEAMPPFLAVIDARDARAVAGADQDVQLAIEELDQSLRELELVNVRELTEHSLAIEGGLRRSYAAERVLTVLDVLLACAIGALAVRRARSYLRRQEERAADLELFGARVAHDICSPLAAVGLALEVAPQHIANPQIQDLVRRSASTLQDVQLMVEGLLDLARAGAAAGSHRCEVAPALEGLIGDLRSRATTAGITLRCGEIPEVALACPPGALLVLVSNLVENAFKYLGDAAEREVAIRILVDAAKVRFEIEDSGPGVPSGFEARIFEPFARGPGVVQPGAGLGLTTVRRVAEAYGGRAGMGPAPG
jgi:signal transduction histidine kinase